MAENTEAPVVEKPPVSLEIQVKDAMETISGELGKSNEFITAVHENLFRAFGKGKPGEKPKQPMPFDIGSEHYEYSVQPEEREGHAIDDSLRLTRGKDSLFLQTLHSSLDLSDLKAEVVLKFQDKTYTGEEALGRIHEAFPRFYPIASTARKVA